VNQVGAMLRWRAAPNLIWTQFDDSDDWVVYHPASADIHLMTGSAYRLWTLVSDEQPRSLDEIVSCLAADLGRLPDDELTGTTRETLAHMDRIGLLWPLAP
jgi:PqqD family protein of HPr-rel-A system